MSRWIPCKSRDFIKKLRKIGFEGPYSGSRHQFLLYAKCRMTLPSNEEYSTPQLKMLLSEVKEIMGRVIDLKEWEAL